MPIPIFQVDAFAAAPFEGNPAAVCPLDARAEVGWMQSVAAEMNLSETAFCWPEGDALRLRWFTPAVEVDLCGHATLATAHVLWETGRLAADATARFVTRSGELRARRDRARIELDFPARVVEPCPAPAGVLEALGAAARFTGGDGQDLLVEVADAASVRGLAPDFSRLRATDVRSVIVTARADRSGVDFVSRFFAPGVGIDEDPVTGSAHCTLGPYWAAKLGRATLVGYQASARGGTVHVRVAGPRVHLGGGAITVLRGELLAG